MSTRANAILVSAIVAGALGACQATIELPRDAEVAPRFQTASRIVVPTHVGTRATPFDGRFEGYFIAETKKCLPEVEAYHRMTMDISEGLVRSVGLLAGYNADGFVNDNGAFLANMPAGDVSLTFSGRVEGDRLSGEWDAWGVLCGGRVELIRVTDGRHYCVDRLSGRPYASAEECIGIDTLLTRAEYEAKTGATKSN